MRFCLRKVCFRLTDPHNFCARPISKLWLCYWFAVSSCPLITFKGGYNLRGEYGEYSTRKQDRNAANSPGTADLKDIRTGLIPILNQFPIGHWSWQSNCQYHCQLTGTETKNGNIWNKKLVEQTVCSLWLPGFASFCPPARSLHSLSICSVTCSWMHPSELVFLEIKQSRHICTIHKSTISACWQGAVVSTLELISLFNEACLLHGWVTVCWGVNRLGMSQATWVDSAFYPLWDGKVNIRVALDMTFSNPAGARFGLNLFSGHRTVCPSYN